MLRELEEKVDTSSLRSDAGFSDDHTHEFNFGALRGKRATGLNDSRCHDFDGFDEYFE